MYPNDLSLLPQWFTQSLPGCTEHKFSRLRTYSVLAPVDLGFYYTIECIVPTAGYAAVLEALFYTLVLLSFALFVYAR